jgi:hypothetical protein
LDEKRRFAWKGSLRHEILLSVVPDQNVASVKEAFERLQREGVPFDLLDPTWR